MKDTKILPLYKEHVRLGAKISPFAGYLMPVYYSGIKEEHLAVRNQVGIFDVSHMGEIEVIGDEALSLIQYLTCNDAAKLTKGQIQYTALVNPKGGIVDDLLVYKFTDTKYMLVVNAANIQKDIDWLQCNNHKQVTIYDKSTETMLLAVQGPNAQQLLQHITDIDLKKIKYYHFEEGKLADVDVMISATGYTGAGGFEIYAKKNNVITLWNEIFNYGKIYGLLPVGLGARDTLRIEKGYCLYGNDINEKTTTLEAGLGWITKFSKDFIALNHLKEIKKEGINKKLVGLELLERGIPRSGCVLLSFDGENIGTVTSGTMSPSLNKSIGMGYVDVRFKAPDTLIYMKVRNKMLKCKVVKMPFVA